jgi:hypothetical protein
MSKQSHMQRPPVRVSPRRARSSTPWDRSLCATVAGRRTSRSLPQRYLECRYALTAILRRHYSSLLSILNSSTVCIPFRLQPTFYYWCKAQLLCAAFSSISVDASMGRGYHRNEHQFGGAGMMIICEIPAYCGLNCCDCPAYIATQANDEEALRQTAERLSKEMNLNITVEDCICDGCRPFEGARHGGYCAECPIRTCGIKRAIRTAPTAPTTRARTSQSRCRRRGSQAAA